jgi:hypothetical protein
MERTADPNPLQIHRLPNLLRCATGQYKYMECIGCSVVLMFPSFPLQEVSSPSKLLLVTPGRQGFQQCTTKHVKNKFKNEKLWLSVAVALGRLIWVCGVFSFFFFFFHGCNHSTWSTGFHHQSPQK